MPHPPLLPREPVGALTVGSSAARLYTAALPTVLPLAIPAALAATLTELLQAGTDEADAVVDAEPGAALAILVLTVIYGWLVIAVQHRVFRFAQGAGSTGESLGTAARRLLPTFGATLLAGLGIGLPFALVIGMAVWAWGSGVHAVAVVLGAFAVAGLSYAAIRLATLTAEVVLRPTGPVAGLRASWALSRGHVAHIALVYLVLLVLVIAVLVVAGIVAGVLGLLAPALAGFLASVVSVVLLSVFMLPFGAAVVVTLWSDLRQRAGEAGIDG